MKKYDLSFQFKGGRNYVHGTDLFNQVNELAVQEDISLAGQVQMSIHRMIHENLTAHWIEGDMIENPAAVFVFTEGSNREVLALTENGNSVEERYAYDEDSIGLQAEITDQEIIHQHVAAIEYSNIEKVVALNKVHLQHLFQDNVGKWIFSKLSVSGDFKASTVKTIKIELKKRIGLRLTKSNIYFDNRHIGEIYFSSI